MDEKVCDTLRFSDRAEAKRVDAGAAGAAADDDAPAPSAALAPEFSACCTRTLRSGEGMTTGRSGIGGGGESGGGGYGGGGGGGGGARYASGDSIPPQSAASSEKRFAR